MRLWTLHPRYLDSQGLVALWREALLAQKVLRGETKGYQRHPQLDRFRATPEPQAAIATYLLAVHAEADGRGYAFDGGKIGLARFGGRINATEGQVEYEWRHLMGKLERRDPARHERHGSVMRPEVHPLFQTVPGGVADWERV